MTKSNNNNLGYLGVDFQYKLVKCFIEDQNFFINLQHIVDQNMFTEDSLRRIVAFMKDRYSYSESVATYFDLEVLIRSKVSDPTTIDIMIETLKTIKDMDLSGMDLVEDETEKFFKQQNLTKAINQSIEIIKRGNASDYYAIEDIIKKALEINTKQDNGFRLFENLESDLREDYRQPIPTGVKELDLSLYGGLGRGELGLVVAPMGVGKAQPLNARILTPDGIKCMGDISIGSDVIGADGHSYKVTGVYSQGMRPIYKVTFSNGTSCECDIDHLWAIDRSSAINFNRKDCEVLSLREIMSDSQFRSYKIPTHNTIEFSSRPTKKDPYLFAKDEFRCDGCIPEDIVDYVFNSIETRKEFIRGLLHSGVVKCNIKDDYVVDYEIVKIKRNLANPIKILLKSLGNSCKLVDLDEENCKLQWKNKNYKETITFADIEYVRNDMAQCIMVDSSEHLYITEDFIVTHNTSIMTGFGAYAATCQCENNNNQGYKVLHFFFEDKDESIRRKYYGYVLDMDACTLSEPYNKAIALDKLNGDELECKKLLKENLICERLVSGETTASQIKDKIKTQIARGFKPDLVIIDYFECLKPEKTSGFSDSEWTREGVTMRKLESICNEMNIALWVPVQSTKGAIGQDFVGLQHAGGSVTKTQIGHVIITLARTDEQKSQGRLNLYIQKLRAVKIGRDTFSNVKFNNGTCRFDMSNLDSVDSVAALNDNVSRQIAKDVKRDMRYNG